MNRSLRPVVPAALLILLVACATSAPPDRIAYVTIDDAVSAVQTGMRAFNELYQQGKATESDREKVLVAYKQFQAIARTATDLAMSVSPMTRPSVYEIVSRAALDMFYTLEQFGIVPKKV